MDIQTKGPAKTVSPGEAARRLRQEYAGFVKDPRFSILDALNEFLIDVADRKLTEQEILDRTAKLIFKHFSIKEVAIGTKSASDGLYRYAAMCGMRESVWESHKQLSYQLADFSDSKKWRGTDVSAQTRLFLAEENPYHAGEETTYSRHLMQASKRKAVDESIEGDYLDIHSMGPGNELLAWIEISGTWNNKMPNAFVVRGIELVASVLGLLLHAKRLGTKEQTA